MSSQFSEAIPESYRLYMGNIPLNFNLRELQDLFMLYGLLDYIQIVKTNTYGNQSFYAFASYLDMKIDPDTIQKNPYKKLGDQFVTLVADKSYHQQSVCLFKNLSKNQEKHILHNLAQQAGTVTNLILLRGENTSIALVSYASNEEANNACKILTNAMLDSNQIEVFNLDDKNAPISKTLYFERIMVPSEKEANFFLQNLFEPFGGLASCTAKKRFTGDFKAFLSCHNQGQGEYAHEYLKKIKPYMTEDGIRLSANWLHSKDEQERYYAQRTLFAKNLNPWMMNDEIKQFFEQFGMIKSFSLLRYPNEKTQLRISFVNQEIKDSVLDEYQKGNQRFQAISHSEKSLIIEPYKSTH